MLVKELSSLGGGLPSPSALVVFVLVYGDVDFLKHLLPHMLVLNWPHRINWEPQLCSGNTLASHL